MYVMGDPPEKAAVSPAAWEALKAALPSLSKNLHERVRE
jgi:hypothetical protein